MVGEAVVHTSKERNQPNVLPSYNTCELQQWPEWHNNPLSSGVHTLAVTNSFLNKLKILSISEKLFMILEI